LGFKERGEKMLIFSFHIFYEHYRLRNSPRAIALHTASAVAVGGFLLAVSAMIHALSVGTQSPFWLYLIALVAWPIFTAVPAFLVAFVAGFVLGRLPRRV
jgi:hypothetical protein